MTSSWVAELRAGFHAFADSVRKTLPYHVPLYACAILFLAITFAITTAYNVPMRLGAGSFFFGMVGQFAMLALGLLAAFEFTVLARSGFPSKPLRRISSRLFGWLMQGDRPGNFFHSLVAFPILTISFCALKDAIPRINPFSWDKTFMQFDRFVSFGHTPGELLQPALGHPAITAAINVAYNVWFLLLFGVLFWQAFSTKTSVRRMQYLLAYSLAWFVAGNVLAVVFSSAGPCFYGRLHIGSDPYAAQMAYLRYVSAHWPMQDASVQDLLWHMHVARSGNLGGISAMPSLHVTSTVLMALLAWRTNRKLGWAFIVFTAVIIIGSIHLAWHYVADVLAGIVLAVIFWVVAGYIATAWHRYLEHTRAKSQALIGTAIPTGA